MFFLHIHTRYRDPGCRYLAPFGIAFVFGCRDGLGQIGTSDEEKNKYERPEHAVMPCPAYIEEIQCHNDPLRKFTDVIGVAGVLP